MLDDSDDKMYDEAKALLAEAKINVEYKRAQRESRMPGGLATDCRQCIKAGCTHKVFGNRIKCRTGKHSTPTQQLTKPHDMPSLECMDCGGICSGGGWSWTAAHQGEVPCCCTVDDPSRIFAVVETQARRVVHGFFKFTKSHHSSCKPQ